MIYNKLPKGYKLWESMRYLSQAKDSVKKYKEEGVNAIIVKINEEYYIAVKGVIQKNGESY